MNRFFVLASALAVMLLVGWGCEQEQAVVAPPPPPAVAEPQPAETGTAVEPKAAEAEQKPAPAVPAESNLVQVRPAPHLQEPAAELCGRCTEFLSRYVDDEGLVDYRTLSRKKLELVEVLDKFKTLDANEYNSWSKEDKLAFWINGYNLELIKILLDNYPIESTRVLRLFWPPNSIRHIKGIWDQHKFIIKDEEFTLQEIDRRFFKGEFDEPRVFFAIYYGSLSGPPLWNKAYCGKDLSAQLDERVKNFLAGLQAFRIDREDHKVYLSSILKPTWNGQQFIAKYGTDLKFKQQEPAVRAVLNFLTKYIFQSQVDYLETANYTVEYMGYNWTLNDRGSQ